MNALKELKKGNIAKVYLLYGEEKYKLKVYKDSFKTLVPFGNEMNYSYFEGKNIDLKAVYDSVMTLPFFADKRLVIVENSGKFKGKKKGEEDETGSEGSEEQKDIISEMINDMPDTTCLVFIEDQILKTKKEYKLILKTGVVEECAADTPQQIASWIQKGFKTFDKAIDKNNAMLLIDRAGTDYTVLKNEIEKVASYMGDREIVEKDDICAVTINNIESKIFDMLSYMSEKNIKAVMSRYYDMLQNKDEPRMIMAMIRRQFRIMLQVDELYKKGYRDDEIASLTKQRDFVVRKMKSYIRNGYDERSMIKILELINDVDMRTKNGNLEDRLGVELILIEASK